MNYGCTLSPLRERLTSHLHPTSSLHGIHKFLKHELALKTLVGQHQSTDIFGGAQTKLKANAVLTGMVIYCYYHYASETLLLFWVSPFINHLRKEVSHYGHFRNSSPAFTAWFNQSSVFPGKHSCWTKSHVVSVQLALRWRKKKNIWGKKKKAAR